MVAQVFSFRISLFILPPMKLFVIAQFLNKRVTHYFLFVSSRLFFNIACYFEIHSMINYLFALHN